MPIYEYQCRSCGAVTDVRHGFGERPSEPCPACGGELARVFSAAPIVFKGSGFYKTDSRKPAADAKPAADGKPAPKSDGAAAEAKPKTESGATDAGSPAKSDAKPAGSPKGGEAA